MYKLFWLRDSLDPIQRHVTCLVIIVLKYTDTEGAKKNVCQRLIEGHYGSSKIGPVCNVCGLTKVIRNQKNIFIFV